jgi:1-acyl-sn-glycerol-3-phosphate acyltransferase
MAKTIDQWSPGYWLLKYLWIRNTINIYYRRIEKRNAKVISLERPVIIVANHQNALMDAMAIVTQFPLQTIFMTRADIFSKPLLRKVLMWLKMLPIYRIRDGVESLGKNEEIFETTTAILRNHISPLGIFPEGNHGDRRRLRSLLKGTPRIALRAQEEYGATPWVQIVPVGIDYSHYQKFRQTLFLNVGQPIEVADYWEKYQESPATAINKLRARIGEEMRKCMIDIRSEEYYETYMGLRLLARPLMLRKMGLKKRSLSHRFDADKALIAALDRTLEAQPETMAEIHNDFSRYAQLRDRLGLRDWVFTKKKYPFGIIALRILLILGLLPMFAVGFLTNWPHYYMPQRVARKIKDPQFRSTASWGAGIVVQAVYYFLLMIPAFIFLPWWAAIAAIISLPFLGVAAMEIRTLFVKTRAMMRYESMRKKSAEIAEILTLQQRLLDFVKKVV